MTEGGLERQDRCVVADELIGGTIVITLHHVLRSYKINLVIATKLLLILLI